MANNPKYYIIESSALPEVFLKVAEAKRLLLYTGKSAKEISEILGFEDLATFSRFFKKMNKESLSEYRKREKRE